MFGAFMEGLFTITLVGSAVIPPMVYHHRKERREQAKQQQEQAKVERNRAHIVNFANRFGSAE